MTGCLPTTATSVRSFNLASVHVWGARHSTLSAAAELAKASSLMDTELTAEAATRHPHPVSQSKGGKIKGEAVNANGKHENQPLRFWAPPWIPVLSSEPRCWPWFPRVPVRLGPRRRPTWLASLLCLHYLCTFFWIQPAKITATPWFTVVAVRPGFLCDAKILF